MDIPESMIEELSKWNNGSGIDLHDWASCSGSFSLAVGYVTLLWPDFVEYEGYILRKDFSKESLRGFESQEGITRKAIEWVMNHIHLDGLHGGCDDISKDKLIYIGVYLKEMYEAKLKLQFPDREFCVEFYVPDDNDVLEEYQLSFWQKIHE